MEPDTKINITPSSQPLDQLPYQMTDRVSSSNTSPQHEQAGLISGLIITDKSNMINPRIKCISTIFCAITAVLIGGCGGGLFGGRVIGGLEIEDLTVPTLVGTGLGCGGGLWMATAEATHAGSCNLTAITAALITSLFISATAAMLFGGI